MTDARKILIAHDDPTVRLQLSRALVEAGRQVRATASTPVLLKWAREGEVDLVVAQRFLSDEPMIDALSQIRRAWPTALIITLSAQESLEAAVEAAEVGAFDHLCRPFDPRRLVHLANTISVPPSETTRLKERVFAERENVLPMIGRSKPMQEVYKAIARFIGLPAPVLILGESGAGKGVAARALHDLSPRRAGRFVTLNLAALPRQKIEAELFGDGGDDLGKLALAQGGTLFLDEVGDMPLDAQQHLRGVLDDLALNARQDGPATRVIAATNRDLPSLVQQGQFRQDLYFRLNAAPLRLPPLRERRDDIGLLAQAFLVRAASDGLAVKYIAPDALERLKWHEWPGNVRELENLMRRVCATLPGVQIDAKVIERELADYEQAPAQEWETSLSQVVRQGMSTYLETFAGEEAHPLGLYERILHSIEAPLIEMALSASNGNFIKASAILGINRNTLRKKIRSQKIDIRRTPQPRLRHRPAILAARS